jgi:hypothetical protein
VNPNEPIATLSELDDSVGVAVERSVGKWVLWGVVLLFAAVAVSLLYF